LDVRLVDGSRPVFLKPLDVRLVDGSRPVFLKPLDVRLVDGSRPVFLQPVSSAGWSLDPETLTLRTVRSDAHLRGGMREWLNVQQCPSRRH
jgi:hypothetical protein